VGVMVMEEGRKRIRWNLTKGGGSRPTTAVPEVRKTRTRWREVWEVKRGRFEDETRSHAKPEACWHWRDETAALTHMCIRPPFPRLRTSYRVFYRRISGGVK